MNRGSANIALIIALVVIIAGGAGYWAWTKQPSAPATSSTTELPAMQQDNQNLKNVPSGQQAGQQSTANTSEVIFTATPTNGAAPLAVVFGSQMKVPTNQSGNAIVYFGDGKSDAVANWSPGLFNEQVNHTYTKPGEYDAVLVFTSVTDVKSEPEVITNPNYYKNILIKGIHIIVN